MSKQEERPLNGEIIEVKPAIFGGSPTDPQNKVLVTREQHFEYVRYWNKIFRHLKHK